jgi:peroxiredoxin
MKTVDDMLPPLELRDHWIVLTCCPNNMTSGCSQETLL